MAEKLNDNLSPEERDALRTLEAVREIAASPNLRYFFRVLLGSCGVNSTPQGLTALDLARACGRHEIGSELRATLQQNDPALYPDLLKEELDEQNDEHSY